MATALSDAAVERWRLLLEEAGADEKWAADNQQLDSRRRIVQREILELVKRYSAGDIDSEQFRDTFHRKTFHEWDAFGFKGMSGAMFLNMLVKHVPDQHALKQRLLGILDAPRDGEDARQRMQGFLQFLETCISSGEVTKREIQPARASFFVPLWWHLWDTERWPIYYPLSRKAFELEGLYSPTLDPVEDYFTFRDRFLSLASALSLSSWQLEHLCVWQDKRHSTSAMPVARREVVEGPDEEEAVEDRTAAATHTEIQWLLAKLGRAVGCRVWIAANDRNREWNGERLGDLGLPSLPPLGMDDDSRRLIERIDVLWLEAGRHVAAAFEIEHTTHIYSGLLRMSDLVTLSPNLNFPLYIVTSPDRLDQVRRQLLRPTFQALDLDKRCGFFSDETLRREAESMMRYATGPSVIERIASKVEDAASDPAN